METVCYPRYVNLSERRRGEVDEVRVRGLKRLLEEVTLVSFESTYLYIYICLMK